MLELSGLTFSLVVRNFKLAPGSELAVADEDDGAEDIPDLLKESLERRKGLLAPLKSFSGLIRRSSVPKLVVSESEKSFVRSLGRPRLRELFFETTFITFLRAGLLRLRLRDWDFFP